nr:immunoglobulin heavy chain junction region [Macaca mulatta]MPN75305.1 immunoglobulin heavy chain junction region [Macaca mulatta]MPN75464.1 immunoglobulin heavy chain junction region [Macaca mulatta]MPN76413.1 immunoglobulin heavy chain junction region [Macaca mulatta]MPN76738.1 immunoglobulin heavy chain junction region [Macaca mulatta]
CARDRGRIYGGVFNNFFDVW